MTKGITIIFFWFISFFFSHLLAQTFTKITDQSNVIVTDSFPGGYQGTAWVDYNNDGLLDLFINNDYLYKNEGNGNFSKNLTFKGRTQSLNPTTISSGSSWADYDNDGDLDMFSASSKSFLFRNEGNETFERISTGVIGDSLANRGWTCVWADYDNDGNLDLLIVHPANFVPGTPIPNLLFHNDGPPDYTFTKVTDFHFTTQLAPYTVATWSDYDLDGDVDLFIGSGPATGTPARDYLYKNMLKETDSVSFERINDSPIGTDLQDGQVWNFIDYDNDADLDAFITNYGAAPNRFYKNDNGIFTSITTGMELGSQSCLSNSWGDFDNDGYLDVVITSETKTYFFHNNGDGTFSSINNSVSVNG
ncbi:MAG TPA: VCBS repeat-containing protein, partial [Ignavibacteriaceae bacterium]|nr:VCBS repeat-containing protein [Ignavibacteriaceae bacterium]